MMKKRFLPPLAAAVALMVTAFSALSAQPLMDPIPRLQSVLDDSRLASAEKLRSAPATFYVSTEGNDAWSGKLAAPNEEKSDGPFKTLAKAKAALSEWRKSDSFKGGPTSVIVRGGLYELTEPLTFDKSDSGSAESPIYWFAAAGEEVRISGGRTLRGAAKVTDPAILQRLRPEVRDKVVQIDLAAQQIENVGSPDGSAAELFFNNEPQTVSRYPNDGFLKIIGLTKEGTHEVDIRGTKGIAEGNFQFDDDRLLSWEKETDVWVNGYWFWDWANSRQKVASIKPETKTMILEGPNHSYGYRVGQWFYAYNLLCEIDVPGEYFIDREKKILYFLPPKEVTDDSLLLTMIPNVIVGKDVSNLTLCGFLFEGCRDTAVSLSGNDDLVAACQIRNVGGMGISIWGDRNLLFGNRLTNLGKGGLAIGGGENKSLRPGNNAAVDNVIDRYGRVQRMYAAGIHLNGVGNFLASNKITDAPHCAILFGGNDQLIALNEIARVCEESNDAGAIYCGRNWTMRGNLLKNNYLHDIQGFQKRGCVGMYLDDMFSTADMIGNLYVNVTRAAFIGGGRDNTIANNVFVDCKPSIHIDARALGWCHDHADGWVKEAGEKGTISGIAWNKPPYSDRYPKLAKILDGQPLAPEGNVVARNIIVGGSAQPPKEGENWRGEGDSVEGKARDFVTFENNLVGVDPLFVDASAGDYRLKPESPALKFGFEQLPFDRMGDFPHPLAVK